MFVRPRENIDKQPPLSSLDAGEAQWPPASVYVCLTSSHFVIVILSFWTRSLVVTHAAASLDPFVVTFSPPIWVTTTSAAPLAVASHPTPLFSAASHAPLVVASIIAPYPLYLSSPHPLPIALSYGSRVFQLFLRANSFRQSSIKIPGQDHTPMLLSVTYTLSKEKESLPSPVLVSTNCLQTRCLGSPVSRFILRL
uniref:Uncharacterized protein n=1 Tax=Brassica oleracea var. oleracea TaxID=109376 RepID=A0A0D3A2Y7_BRAOL